jgi:hypothetical protein
MNQAGSTTNDTIEPICPSYLVELSVVTASGQEGVGEDMKNFTEQLKPYPLFCIVKIKDGRFYWYISVYYDIAIQLS